MKEALLTLVMLFLAGPVALVRGDPQYEDGVVLVGVPAQADSVLGTFQEITGVVESMVGVDLVTQDSMDFYCNMVWGDDDIDMAVKMGWNSRSNVSVQDVVDAFLSLGIYAQPNYRYDTFQYTRSQTPIPRDRAVPVPLDLYSRFQVPYPLGGEDLQSGLRYTKVTESWSYADGTDDVILQVNDTGGIWGHPELGPNVWQNLGEDADGDGATIVRVVGGWLFDPDDENGVDDDGNGLVDDLIGWDFMDHENDPAPNWDGFVHGNAVGSVAGAVDFNGVGMYGVARPPVRLQFVRTGSWGWIWTWPAIDGLGYAIFNNLMRGTHVVANISWGALSWPPSDDYFLEHQVECFKREGGLLVFAAGNYGDTMQTYPAAYHQGLIVCATDRSNLRAPWSTYGPWIWPDGLSFPGNLVIVMRADVFMGDADISYGFASGTSFSAPGVAGAAANYWAAHPGLSNDEVMAAVLSSVYAPANYPGVNPDPDSVEEYIGTGILDALELMQSGAR